MGEMLLAEKKRQLASLEATKVEVYSRIVGYYRCVKNWNKGKTEEYTERSSFDSVFEKRA